MFPAIKNGFNSQLVNAVIKSTVNRTRGHNLKLIKQTCSVDATKYYFIKMYRTHYDAILLSLQRCMSTFFSFGTGRVDCLGSFYISSFLLLFLLHYFMRHLYCFVCTKYYYGSVDYRGPSAFNKLID